ncbi:hypothetical protein AX16_010344 [Volvariella volvacea WC 439]|nr:hypothetical protein AX16_010344 [Volvariella volvacea WC 439]
MLTNFAERVNHSSSNLVLPSELVCEIFQYVIGGSLICPHGLLPSYDAHLTLTSICRHWRHAAIAHGPFWSTIVFKGCDIAWIAELIRRSKDCPLTIIIHLYTSAALAYTFEDHKRILALTLSQLHRIRVLDLDLLRDLDEEVLPWLLRPALILRRVRLSYITILGDAHLFDTTAPVLEELSISDVRLLKWSPHLSFFCFLPQLTHFSITCVTPSPTLLQLTDILRSMPTLQSLEIRETLSFSMADPYPTTIPVMLGSLARLTLDEPVVACSALLDCICVNPESSVHISLTSTHSEYELILSFLSRFGKAVDGEQITYIEELFVEERPFLFEIRGDTLTPRTDRYHSGGFTFRLKDTSLFTPWQDLVPQLACDILDSLPLQRLRSLSSTSIPMRDTQWRQVFGNLVCLGSISFTRNHHTNLPLEFFQAIFVPETHIPPGTPIPFPALNFLSFDQPIGLWYFDLLCSWLRVRKDLGHLMKCLVFEVILDDVQESHIVETYHRLGLEYQKYEPGREFEGIYLHSHNIP